ncbi:MAG: hypothetical protein ABS36_06090 [Acidobacteria bacterium SCN 69-37]|nr:MAG: hypothetical protein ABS36_06090 [Acidobacteria bacterium SCN 69-37]
MPRVFPCAAVVAAVILLTGCMRATPATPAATAGVSGTDARGPLPPRDGRIDDLRPGVLLVASRDLRDPNFIETVILLVLYGDDGAMGLVLNRETDVPVGRIFESGAGADDRSGRVFLGGPVAPSAVQALVRSAGVVTHGRRVLDDVHVVGSAEALRRRMDTGIDRDRFRIYLGYSGWGPGQLEREMARGGWHIVDADADLVFDREPATLWRRQIRRTDVLMASTPRPLQRSASAERAISRYTETRGFSLGGESLGLTTFARGSGGPPKPWRRLKPQGSGWHTGT